MVYFLLNSLKRGGAERVAQILSSELNPAGVILLEKDIEYTVVAPVHILSSHSFRTGRIVKTLCIPLYIWRMRDFVRKGDVVVSFIERANFVNVFAKLLFGTKAIVTVHTPLTREYSRGSNIFYKYVIKYLYPFADRVIAVSQGVAYDLLSFCAVQKGNLEVIHNPINITAIEHATRQPFDNHYDRLFQQYPVIINAGRLSLHKGQWNLLRIVRLMRDKNIPAKLCILGDGALRSRLVSYARSLGLRVYAAWEEQPFDNNCDVYFAGMQENPFVFMNHATVFALSSNIEGFPMVLIEAMACGLPIVSTDCTFGPREIFGVDVGEPPIMAYPLHAPHGILMPRLSERFDDKNKGASVEEQLWSEELFEILYNADPQKKYAYAAARRASDFSASAVAARWRGLIAAVSGN